MDPKRHRGWRAAALIATIAVVATACGSSTATPAPTGAAPTAAPTGAAPSDSAQPSATAAGQPKMGGKIVTAIEGEPASVDPAFDYDFVSGLATSSSAGQNLP